MKKRLMMTIIAPVFALMMVGCSAEASTETAAQPEAKAEQTQQEPSQAEKDKGFVKLMRSELDPKYLKGSSDKDIVDGGKGMCRSLENNGVAPTVDSIMSTVSTQWGAEQAGIAMGISVGYYCPSYSDDVVDHLESMSTT